MQVVSELPADGQPGHVTEASVTPNTFMGTPVSAQETEVWGRMLAGTTSAPTEDGRSWVSVKVESDFDGSAQNSMALRAGEHVRVDQSNAADGWYWAQDSTTAKEGWVPGSHLYFSNSAPSDDSEDASQRVEAFVIAAFDGGEMEHSLPIDSGDVLDVEVVEGEAWWWGASRKDDSEGWVPAAYLQLP